MNGTPLQLLDCSLRDGGYLNQWDFPLELIRGHLRALQSLGVPLCEVGFRSPSDVSASYQGLVAHSPHGLLAELKELAPSVKLGVMVNRSDFVSSKALIERFREDTKSEALSFVRVATVLPDFPDAIRMATDLRELGLEVFLNLMQISAVDFANLETVLSSSLVADLSGIYLADSFGALKPETMSRLVQVAVGSAGTAVGVHCHDNLGLAYANSRAAQESGATFIDGTVLGIGRGAGNAPLEFLALEYLETATPMGLLSLIEPWRIWASEAKELTSWGPSLEYGLAATKGVHPTYVQTMMESQSFGPQEIIKVVEELGEKAAAKYSEPMLDVGADWFDVPGVTDDGLGAIFSGRHVLLLGGGRTTLSFHEEISRLVGDLNPVVCAIGANIAWPVSAEYQVISHPMTILSRPTLLSSGVKKIGPFSQMPNELVGHLPLAERLSVDLCVTEDSFGFDGTRVHSPSSRSSIFSLALVAGLDVESVLLVGFDGYASGDTRNQDFDRALGQLRKQQREVFSLTPTILDVVFRSFVW